MEEEKVQELTISKDGISLKSVTVNTVITLATAFGVGFTAIAIHEHKTEAKEANSLFVGAVREQTTAMREATTVQRENNCLQSYQGPAQEKASFCRTVSR